MSPKFRVTLANKYLSSKGLKYKFAISVNQSFFFSDVFLFLNSVSFAKNALNRLKNSITLDQLYDRMNMDFVPREAMLDADEVVFGIDGSIRKVTLVDKSGGLIQKFIHFKSETLAQEWASDYKSKLVLFGKCNSILNIPTLKFEKIIDVLCSNSTVQITSAYENKLKKVRLFDIPDLCNILLNYVESGKNRMKHADFKIYNIRRLTSGEFFVFDLESLSNQLTDKEMYQIFIEPYESNRFYSFNALLAYAYIRLKLKKHLIASE